MAPLDTSRLEALLESASLLHASLDLDELLRHLLRSVMGRLLVSRACIAVRDDAGTLRVSLARGAGLARVGEAFDQARGRAAGLTLAWPIGRVDAPVGLLAVGAPPPGRLEAEAAFIEALLGMAATAIANARAHAETERLTGELGQKIQELRALLDLARGFGAAEEPEAVAQMLALTLAGRWAVGRYLVAAWMQGHDPVVRRRGIQLEEVTRFEPFLQDLPEVIAVEDLPGGPLASALRAGDARLLLPIRTSAVRGLVALGTRAGGRAFEEAGYEFGSALVAQAAVAFENSWRLRETLARKKAEQELALAASIQEGLFPAGMPALAGFDLAAFNRHASRVGGDYYDAIPARAGSHAGSCLLCVADVSGKGLPAALLMSTIQATLRALQARTGSLVDLVAETSELLFATTPGNKYATAILVRLDPLTGMASYVNAGHTRCLVVRGDGRVEGLEPCGPPMGLLPGMTWDEKDVRICPGDTLALFSDGVTEAWNSTEEEFGEERLVEVLRRAEPTAEACVSALVQAIDAFAGAAPQHDDITILIARGRGDSRTASC